MSITFKDLENFLISAEAKTLSEASEKLNMTQPSLSLGIQKLEKELETKLFIRSRDGIKLTPHGKSLLPEAIEALNLLKKIKGERTNTKYKIGCHPSVGMFILGDFLKWMNKTAPLLDFEIINGSSAEIHKKVSQGDIDFGIVMNPLPVQGLIVKIIGEDEVLVWKSKEKYQNKLILNAQMFQSHSILSRWKNAPGERIEVENLELIAKLVQSGAGMGILPFQVVQSQNLKLTRVPNTPSSTDQLALTCYPEMLKTKEGKIIFESLKKSFKKKN